jgi:LMBR1 domain-containing protein 1
MAGDGENWFLIFVTLVVTGLALVGNLYLLANYQHSEDRNQAWFPKIVVITGLTLAELSVLMLPLDVGNRAACSQEIALSACNFTLPMKELWYTVYMTMMVLITVVIPFSLFYYEGDSDRKCLGRWWDSSKWVVATVIPLAATVGIAYAIVGYMDYTVEELSSGMISLSDSSRLADATECIAPDSVGFQGYLCDATKADALPPTETWSVRTSFPVYVMALAACIGWVLFIVFAGVGVVALPVDLLLDCINFPRTVITKTEYVR